MSRVKKPEVGDYVQWDHEYLNGRVEQMTGRVDSLLSTMFTLYVQGRDVPYFVFYSEKWEVV